MIFTQTGSIVVAPSGVLDPAAFVRQWFEDTWLDKFGLVGAVAVVTIATSTFWVCVFVGTVLLKLVVRPRTPVGQHKVLGSFHVRRALLQNVQDFSWKR